MHVSHHFSNTGSSSAQVNREETDKQPEEIKFLDVFKLEKMVCALSKNFMLDPTQLPCKHNFSTQHLIKLYARNGKTIYPRSDCQKPYHSIKEWRANEERAEIVSNYLLQLKQPNKAFIEKVNELYTSIQDATIKQSVHVAVNNFFNNKEEEGMQQLIVVILQNPNTDNTNNDIYRRIYNIMDQQVRNASKKKETLLQQVPTVEIVQEVWEGFVSGNGAAQHSSTSLGGNNMVPAGPDAFYRPVLEESHEISSFPSTTQTVASVNGRNHNLSTSTRKAMLTTPPPTEAPPSQSMEQGVIDQTSGSLMNGEGHTLSTSSTTNVVGVEASRSNSSRKRHRKDEDRSHLSSNQTHYGDSVPIEPIAKRTRYQTNAMDDENSQTEQEHEDQGVNHEVSQGNSLSSDGQHLINLLTNSNRGQIYSAISTCDNVHIRDQNGNTPLHLAVLHYGKTQRLIEALFNKGADLNAKNNDDDTALHLAVKLNKVTTIKELLDLGANRNMRNNKTGAIPAEEKNGISEQARLALEQQF